MASKYDTKAPVEQKKYPPTIDMIDGSSIVAAIISVRHDVPTKYGPRDVAEVVTHDADDVIKSLWWPKKLPMPPLMTPFHLNRVGKGAYVLTVSDNDDEGRAMWKTGAVPTQGAGGAATQADPLPANAAAIVAKFKG